MNKNRPSLLTGAVSLAVCLSLTAAAAVPGQMKDKAKIAEKYGKVPLHFEPNAGQAPAGVRFLSTTNRATLQLRDSDAVLRTVDGTLRMSIAGGSATRPQAGDLVSSKTNYYIGNNRSQWREGVANYRNVRYPGIYPGVDLVFYGTQRQLEYDLVVAPGTSPASIRLRFDGQRSMQVDPNGDLLLQMGSGFLRQTKPVAYQETAAGRTNVAAAYRIAGNEVSFRVGEYDRGKPLIIDPVVVFSKLIGGTFQETADAIAIDRFNNAYIAGYTLSQDYPPVAGPNGTTRGSVDAMVTKLDAAGTVIVYTTFVAGSANDFGFGVATDATGNAYITGQTMSADFPRLNPVQGTMLGTTDAFLAKLNTVGGIMFSTYLGGSGSAESATGIAIDISNAIYISGYTDSVNLPAAVNASSGGRDGFVMKINPLGDTIVYSSYIGGPGTDTLFGIALDRSNNAFVAGETNSTNTRMGVQPNYAGGITDGFVAKVSASGALVAWSYVGGSSTDRLTGVAVDRLGDVYVTGDSLSSTILNSPASRTFANPSGPDYDLIVGKLNTSLTQWAYTRFVGGSLGEQAGGIAVDLAGAAYVSGVTSSTVPGATNTKSGADDAFIAKIHPAGTSLLYFTYIGGPGTDFAKSVAVDNTNAAYFSGYTLSPTFPAGGPAVNGTQDSFIAKFSGCSMTASSLSGTYTAAGGSGAITITASSNECGWLAVPSQPWVTITSATFGTGTGTFTFTVAPTPGGTQTAFIYVGGQTINILQQAATTAGCTYALTPSTLSVGGDGAAGTVMLGTGGNCAWGVSSTATWAQIDYPVTGPGPASIHYTIYPNLTTHARSAVITIGNATVTVSQAATTRTPNERYVTLLYFNFFGRLPSSGELQFQVNALQTNQTDRLTMANGFLTSAEFNQNGRFVAGLYVGLLARDAEYAGWLFQRNALSTGLTNANILIPAFLGSAEYQLAFGNPNDTQYVTLLYQNILLRNPTPAEVQFQVNALQTGQNDRPTMARGFLQSTEFQIGTGPRLTAFLLYATLLQRQIGPQEYFTLVQRLSVPNPPVLTVLQELLNSPEFNNSIS